MIFALAGVRRLCQQQHWKMAVVMLDYVGEYCEAGYAWQSSVTVIMNSNTVLNYSRERLIGNYVSGDGVGTTAAARLKMLCMHLGLCCCSVMHRYGIEVQEIIRSG